MQQSRIQSFIESLVNVGIGLFITVWLTSLISLVFSLGLSAADNMLISSLITLAHVVKTYSVRRVFEWINFKKHVDNKYTR